MRGRTFRRHGDRIRASFDPVDLELLLTTRQQLHDALRRDDPSDPVVQRLFPTAVLGDQDANGELRQLLHDDLLRRRLEGLDELAAMLERGRPHHGGIQVDLVDDEPLLVLGVLNDVRLAIGAGIDIESLDRDAALLDDAIAYRLAVMNHFAAFQDELLAIIDPVSLTYVDHLDIDDDA